MANRIKLKRSSVTGNAPTTGDIEVGEIALNMADQVIHYRDADDNIKQIVHGPANNLEAVDITGTGDFTMDTAGDFTVTNATAFEVVAEQHSGFGLDALPNYVRKRTSDLGTLKSVMSAKLEETDGSGDLISATNNAGADIAFYVNQGEIGNIAIRAKTTASNVNNTLDVANSASEAVVLLRAPTVSTALAIDAQELNLFDSDLTLSTDGTDQTITGAGAVAISSTDSEQSLSVSDTEIVVNTNSAEIMKFTDNEISTQQLLTTKGITNVAIDGPSRAQFIRNSLYGAIEVARNDQGNLADGQTSSSFQYKIQGDDGAAFPGFVYGDYHSVNGNGIIAEVYDDGVSTFTQRKVFEARASEFKVLEADITFTTDGTDQTIDTTGRLDINSDAGNTTLRLGGGVGTDLLTLNGANGGTFYIQTVSNDGFRLQSPDGTDFLEIVDDEITVNLNDAAVATFTDGLMSTTGITNQASSFNTSIVAKRDNNFGSIQIVNNASGDLATGDATGGIQFVRQADDSSAFVGYQYMDYDTTDGNGWVLVAYDDGVSTFDSNDLIVARRQEISLMDNDLAFTTDGTDQTITGVGDVLFDSVIQLQQLADDPGTATNGSMYYNTTTNRFRGYADGSWINLH